MSEDKGLKYCDDLTKGDKVRYYRNCGYVIPRIGKFISGEVIGFVRRTRRNQAPLSCTMVLVNFPSLKKSMRVKWYKLQKL